MRELSGAVPEVVAGVLTSDEAGDPSRCARCEAQLSASFYRVNGRRVCVPCRRRLSGSPVLGVAFGLLAAGANLAAYYGILRLFEMRFLLIAVVTGVAVGSAVRRGTGYAFGFLNRPVALLLTYAAVTTTYLHSVLELSGGVQALGTAWLDAFTLPFRMGLEGKNLVTLALLALGLHEAWQFSKPPKVHQEGPFQVEADASAIDTH